MLRDLHITGLGVIERAELTFGPGLTVLTGETGAGKTLVVTALQLLAGARATGRLVRAGAPAALIEARFVPPPGDATTWTGDADEAVVSRELPADDRSRARINGRLAPVAALEATVGAAVEIHGQHDQVRLADPDAQLRLLDRYAGLEAEVADYGACYERWRLLERRAGERRAGARERARELDRLRHELGEIDGAAIDPDEDGRLDERLEVAEHAEEIRAATWQAAHALSSDGAGDPLGVAVAGLRRLHAGDAELAELHDRVEALVAETADLAADLRRYAEHLDLDPVELERLRARRRALAELRRRYGDELGDVLDHAETARRRIAELEEDQDADERVPGALASAAAEVAERADRLHAARGAAAARLADAIATHLRDLGMAHARVEIAVPVLDSPGPRGRDRIAVLVAANPGQPPTPLGGGASGGERSRIALAVAVALADVHDAQVLVFDEVDAGVGGATALAVGRKLATLARAGRQVLCVTHLAQLAAFSDVHLAVEKTIRDGRTTTEVRRIGHGDRAAELARMMSGASDRRAALEHAEALLDDARVAAR